MNNNYAYLAPLTLIRVSGFVFQRAEKMGTFPEGTPGTNKLSGITNKAVEK